MKRQIYLPELLSINIKNYTLYPNGLDYTFDFVKGVNLVLGGNGMGKTTFVNIIRYALIGLYKKPFDFQRTYLERKILGRKSYPASYFSKRMDPNVLCDGIPTVSLKFRVNNSTFEVCRQLDRPILNKVVINGDELKGVVIEQSKYDLLLKDDVKNNVQLVQTLQYSYEQSIYENCGVKFDDFILFVNEILFFGENHRTILWCEDSDLSGIDNIQRELFNKYFNDPELDEKRVEAERQARYYDSLSRHASEDMRPLKSILDELEKTHENKQTSNPLIDLMSANEKLESIGETLKIIQNERLEKSQQLLFLQGEVNQSSLEANEVDKDAQRLETELHRKIWMRLHPSYNLHMRNIQLNKICPMCSQTDEELANRVISNPQACFVCNSKIESDGNSIIKANYERAVSARNKLYAQIRNKQQIIRTLENEIVQLDFKFQEIDLQRRLIEQSKREYEYTVTQDNNNDRNLQIISDKYAQLAAKKEEYQKLSAAKRKEAEDIAKLIESEIEKNVKRFSELFSGFATKFLGVDCALTYEKLANKDKKRLYPVIAGVLREDEEEMSESQRFFIDHAFRMSILSFFYTTPTFYIVETPDSSLDISYEKNAAEVFLHFLEKPNSLIITSNLNNSTFISNLMIHSKVETNLVDLVSIAKTSIVQRANLQLSNIYNTFIQSIKDDERL